MVNPYTVIIFVFIFYELFDDVGPRVIPSKLKGHVLNGQKWLDAQCHVFLLGTSLFIYG